MDRLGLHSPCSTVLVLGTIFSLYPSAVAKMRALPLPKQLRDCYLRGQNYTAQNYVGGLYSWYCESPLRAYIKGSPTPFPEHQDVYYRHLYNQVEAKILPQARVKRQATKCQRKEYRMLTDQERQNFHAALNALKNDTSVEPNKYDALASFHTGVASFMAHGGPAFPGWHTVYLLLWESALQEVDVSVCLPYWDSSLDAGLHNPASSHIWSNDFLGDGDGEVTTGPFAYWRNPDGVTLRRSVGRDGQLFTHQSIAAIMSCNAPEEILLPNADPQFSLESHHGGTHIFVGGDMEMLNTAARDPTFIIHHNFVDYIWRMFKLKMKNNGVDTQRYPVDESISEFHLGTAPMGFGNLTQADGFLDSLMSSYEYMPSPSCSATNPDCGSKYLWCNVTSSRCIPIDPNNPPVPLPGPNPSPIEPCTQPRPQAYQNNFCFNGVCDINQAVWVPVKIISKRPPEFHDYHSYPVQNGKISKTSDIYAPSLYADTSRLVKAPENNPKAYDQCEVKDGVGRIFVSSMGVNYDGSYKESAIIDQRLATSISVTYIAVKDPGALGTTEVLFRAHDQCGRLCHTACKVPDSNPPRYETCSGLVEVTSQHPLGYGRTIASATLQVYDYNTDSYCPTVKTDDFFITFYCDYVDFLPWVEKPTNPRPEVTVPVPRPTLPSSNPIQCRLSDQCTINQICSSGVRQCSFEMETVECIDNCHRYAVCIYGVYWPRLCPSGLGFDQQQGKCVTSGCQNQTNDPIIGSSPTQKGTRRRPTTRPSNPIRVPANYYDHLLGKLNLGKR